MQSRTRRIVVIFLIVATFVLGGLAIFISYYVQQSQSPVDSDASGGIDQTSCTQRCGSNICNCPAALNCAKTGDISLNEFCGVRDSIVGLPPCSSYGGTCGSSQINGSNACADGTVQRYCCATGRTYVAGVGCQSFAQPVGKTAVGSCSQTCTNAAGCTCPSNLNCITSNDIAQGATCGVRLTTGQSCNNSFTGGTELPNSTTYGGCGLYGCSAGSRRKFSCNGNNGSLLAQCEADATACPTTTGGTTGGGNTGGGTTGGGTTGGGTTGGGTTGGGTTGGGTTGGGTTGGGTTGGSGETGGHNNSANGVACGAGCSTSADCAVPASGGAAVCRNGICENAACPAGFTTPGANCQCTFQNSCGQPCSISKGLCAAGLECGFVISDAGQPQSLVQSCNQERLLNTQYQLCLPVNPSNGYTRSACSDIAASFLVRPNGLVSISLSDVSAACGASQAVTTTRCYRCTSSLTDANECESFAVTGTSCPAGSSNQATGCAAQAGGSCPVTGSSSITCYRCSASGSDGNSCESFAFSGSSCPAGSSSQPTGCSAAVNGSCPTNFLPDTAIFSDRIDRIILGIFVVILGISLAGGFDKFRTSLGFKAKRE